MSSLPPPPTGGGGADPRRVARPRVVVTLDILVEYGEDQLSAQATGTHLNSVGRATVVDVGGPSRPFGSLQGCCRRLLAHSSASEHCSSSGS